MRVKYTLLAFMSYIFGGFFLFCLCASPHSSLCLHGAMCVVYAFWLKFTHTHRFPLTLVNVSARSNQLPSTLLNVFLLVGLRVRSKTQNKILYRIKWNRWIKCYEQLQTTIAHIHAHMRARKKVTASGSAQTKLHNLLMVKVIERNRKKSKKGGKTWTG